MSDVLPPELEELLAHERDLDAAPTDLASRLRARIDHSIADLPDGENGDEGENGDSGEGGSEGDATPSDQAPDVTPDSAPGTNQETPPTTDAIPSPDGSAIAQAGTAVGTSLWRTLAWMGVFGAGVAVGVGGHVMLSPAGNNAVFKRWPAEIQEPAPPEPTPNIMPNTMPQELEITPEPPEVPAPSPDRQLGRAGGNRPTRPAPETEAPTPAEDDGRTLLTQAQNALARGLAAEALATLRQHRQQFRRGPLTEEREALTVRAYAASGQRRRAQEEAAIFLARYPRSVFRPLIETIRAGTTDSPEE